jgi:hypothetical protein
MKVDVFLFILVDANGGERSAVCGDTSDTICTGGHDAKGVYHQFESEAYHLAHWAEENGFVLRRSTHTLEG